MQQLSESSSAHQSLENDKSKEELCFDKSLRELKDLRTQLHFAAETCETIFFKSEDKRDIVENTKEYICRAVVTLVDHLGNVSAKLDRFANLNQFSYVELRIDYLKQRMMTSQQYVQKLAICKLRWRENLPTYQRLYIPTATLNQIEKSREDSRDFDSSISSHKILHFSHTSLSVDQLSPSQRNVLTKEIVVRDDLSLFPQIASNTNFHFQLVSSKLRRNQSLSRKSSSPTLLGSDILSLIRRVKKSSAKN